MDALKGFMQTKGMFKLYIAAFVMVIVIIAMLWLATFIFKKHKSDKNDASIPPDKKTKWTGVFFPLGFAAVLVAVLVWFWKNRNDPTFLIRYGSPRAGRMVT